MYKRQHILFVNDGSTDKTAAILQELCIDVSQFTFLNLEKNEGKSGAIRQGVLHLEENNTFDYIGYLDADLATPLTEIPRLISEIEKRDTSPLFIMGARVKLMGTNIKRKVWRHYVGRVFATFVSKMLKIPVYDTQCGAKLIHKSVVFNIFREPLITKWLFDVELIARLESILGVDKMEEVLLEVPIRQWQEIEGSKLKPTDFLKAPFELIKIWRHY